MNASNIDFSLTYIVLTTTQHSYHHNLSSTYSQYALLICCHSFSPANHLLLENHRSLTYGSPRLWNQLPDSFRQPHHSCLDSPPRPLVNSSFSSSQRICSFFPILRYRNVLNNNNNNPRSHHPSLLPSFAFQNLPFQQILYTLDLFCLLDWLHGNETLPDLITLISLFLVSHFIFFVIPCSRLSWLPVSFLLHVKYRIVDEFRTSWFYVVGNFEGEGK